jgi:hypothetical protein
MRSRNAAHVRSLFAEAAVLPKIAPDAVARPSLARWLGTNGGNRVRFLAAPPGAGKTTGVVLWLRSFNGPSACIELPRDCDASDFQALTAEAFASSRRTIVVIDRVDRATRDARAVMERLAFEPPPQVGLIYVARSPAALDLRRAPVLTAGAELLRFDADDVRRLAEAHDVSTTDAERIALVRAASGWAVVIAGAIRTAAVSGVPLPEGLARWRRDDGRIIASLIDDALETAPADDAALFRRILGGEELPTAATIVRLAEAGLFAQETGGRVGLNPLVLAFPSGPRASLEPREAMPTEIEMFGTFHLRIGGQEVRFARRRDRNIVELLALRTDGKATRNELLETFWPGGDRALARQGLRTSCSMIRRAFGACVGEERIGTYFTADAAAVVLRCDRVGNRFHRFVDHVERGREADRSGDPQSAEAHWTAAASLHTGALLAGEEAGLPWIAGAARAVEEMMAEIARRLGA